MGRAIHHSDPHHSEQLLDQVKPKKKLVKPETLGTNHTLIFFCLFLTQTWYFCHSSLLTNGHWCCKAMPQSHFQSSSFLATFFSALQIISCSALLHRCPHLGVHLRTGQPHSDLETLKLHCKCFQSPPCCLMFARFTGFFRFILIHYLQSQVLLILTPSCISWVQLRLSTAKADTRPCYCSPLHTVWKFHCLVHRNSSLFPFDVITTAWLPTMVALQSWPLLLNISVFTAIFIFITQARTA